MSNDKPGSKPETGRARIPVERLVMLFRGKWRYVNYNKEFPQAQCWNSWKPRFDRYWMGDIWQFGWRGHSVSVDMRKDWVADMVNHGRADR